MGRQLGGPTEILDHVGNTVVVSTDADSSNYRKYDNSFKFDIPTTMPIEQIMTHVNDYNRAVSTSPWASAEALKRSVRDTPYLSDEERNDSYNLTAAIINGLHELVTLNAQLETKDPFAFSDVHPSTIENLDNFVDATRENKKRLSYIDINGKDFLLSLLDAIAILRRLFTLGNKVDVEDVFGRVMKIYDMLGADINNPTIIDEVNVLTAVFGNPSVNPVSYVSALARMQMINEASAYCVSKGRDFNQAASEADYVLHSVSTALEKALSREEHRGNLELKYFVDDVEKDYLQDVKNAAIINDSNYDMYRRHKYRIGYDTRGGIFNDLLQEYTDMGLHDGSMILPEVGYNPNREIIVNDPKKPGVGPASTLSNGQLLYRDNNGGTRVVGRKSIWGNSAKDMKIVDDLINGNKKGNDSLFGANSKPNNQQYNNQQGGMNNNYNNGYNNNTNNYNDPLIDNTSRNNSPYNGPTGGSNYSGYNSNNGPRTGAVGSDSPLNRNNYNDYNAGYNNYGYNNQGGYGVQNTGTTASVKSAFDSFKEKYTNNGTSSSSSMNTSYGYGSGYGSGGYGNTGYRQGQGARGPMMGPSYGTQNYATSPNPNNFDQRFINTESKAFRDREGKRNYYYYNGQLYRQHYIDSKWYPVVDNPREMINDVHFEGDKLIKGTVVLDDGQFFVGNTYNTLNGTGDVGGSNVSTGRPVLFGV